MRPRLGVAILVLAVALGTFCRVQGAFGTGLFDAGPKGLLRADPGTLWYLLGRVIEGGGWPDASFAADRHVEHPAVVDCWATFTVGHEFLLAPLHAWLPAVPLHRLCVIVLGLVMSLTAVFVYLLARELTQSTAAAAGAALLFALTPAGYRTIGFVLMNEDLSLPLFAAHLWLLARAIRRRSARSAAAAGVLGVLAAATWHATTFLLALTYGCAALVVAWSGRPLLPRHATRALVATLALASLAVPVLRAKGFAVGFPVQIAIATGTVAALHRVRPCPRGVRLLALAGAVALLALLARGLGMALGQGAGDFAHVVALLVAKVRHLGVFPDDPSSLSFDARIMWQGPFDSMDPLDLAAKLGIGLAAAMAGAVLILRGEGTAARAHPAARVLPVLLAASLVAALLVDRLQVLPAMLVPVAAAAGVQRLPRRALVLAGAGLLVLQAATQARFWVTLPDRMRASWHEPAQIAEVRAALDAIRDLTPADAAIATDPINGGAILAHTGRRIAVQAKWETAASRARLQTLLTPFHLGTTADLHRALREQLQCEYFLVDRRVLWGVCRQMSGIPRAQSLPAPGTAAAAFCSDDHRELTRIPGFQLLYRSPSWIGNQEGRTDYVRLYRVLP